LHGIQPTALGMSESADNDQLLSTYDDEYVAGQLLGEKYELLRPIGEGGMGVVWVAHDRTLDIDVAVKIGRRFVDDSSQLMTRRALSEARLAAQLTHPAICRVLDFGLSGNGDPFVVSELMQGEELDQVLRRERRLIPRVAVRTLLPILDGLAAAHRKGIIHRDVKPANMFLARDAERRVQPKLLDFGVARVANNNLRITEPGMVCGTAYYMSPEQARGSVDLDARSDLWSFCASLYELVSGSPPFDGGNNNEVLSAVLTTDPRPLVQLFVVDAALSVIVMRGLARDPSQRFASAQELGRELAQWLLAQGEEHDICGHSLRERLTTHADLPAPNPRATPASSYGRSRATPHALSSPPAAVERRPRPIARSTLRIGLVSVLLGGLLGILALAVHPVSESPRARVSARRPLEAATSEIAVSAARVNLTTAVVPTSAHPGLGEPNVRPTAQSPVRSERKPVLRVSPIVPNAEPERKIEKQQPVSTTTLLRKRNELGYDFGF
jgi:eukaryotic-like serine/threonine-protein kinase